MKAKFGKEFFRVLFAKIQEYSQAFNTKFGDHVITVRTESDQIILNSQFTKDGGGQSVRVTYAAPGHSITWSKSGEPSPHVYTMRLVGDSHIEAIQQDRIFGPDDIAKEVMIAIGR